MDQNLVFPLVILPFFFLLFLIARSLTTFFHELGHALPALLFTRDKVSIFLGSYGNIDKSVGVRINKRLSVHFKFNPLKWGKGMVQHGPVNNDAQNLFILFFGPLFSLIIATIAIIAIFSFDLNGFLKLSSVIFLLSALFDLRNIFPSKIPIVTESGSVAYNDGYQIARILNFDRNHKKFSLAYKLYADQNYFGALKILETIDPQLLSTEWLDIMIFALHKCKRHAAAKYLYTHLLESRVHKKFSSGNWGNFALTESYLGDYNTALKYYSKSLTLDDNNMNSLLNRGFTYNLMGRYNEGLDDFNKALSIDPNFAYAYANRAYSKMKLNNANGAFADINRSLALDDKNSYAYRTLGLYYLEKGDYKDALFNLKLSHELDSETHLITEYIKEAEDKFIAAAD